MILSRADYVEWAAYVVEECRRFYDHTAGESYIFANTPAANRYVEAAARRGTSTEEAAFTGPWHVVRRHATTEFRQWVEEYEATERLTASQWHDAARAARAAVEWQESAEHTLDQLDMLRRLTLDRDRLILEAARRGAAKTAIAAAVGITRQQVHVIVSRLEAADNIAPVTPITAAPGHGVEPVEEWPAGDDVEAWAAVGGVF